MPRLDVPLFPRQRDYLATFPDEVMCFVSGEAGYVRVQAVADGEVVSDEWVPPEGFDTQPRVRIVDADEG